MPRFESSLQALAGHVGQELAHSDWFPITQERVTRFAEVTEDLQWIHVDPERAARESPFGATVAHGFLTLSLLPRFLGECIHITDLRMSVNYGLNRVRFISPVRVGARLRARFTLKSFDPLPAGAQLVWQALIEVEGQDKPACAADLVARLDT